MSFTNKTLKDRLHDPEADPHNVGVLGPLARTLEGGVMLGTNQARSHPPVSVHTHLSIDQHLFPISTVTFQHIKSISQQHSNVKPRIGQTTYLFIVIPHSKFAERSILI